MSTYFSSDWHLGHSNIIRYDGRPFKDVEEMDHTIISNVVGQLKEDDILYYLGDFALTRSQNAMEGYMKALAYTEANLFFIKGNHDKRDTIKLYERYGTYLGEQKKIKISDPETREGVQEIVLNHFSMRTWDKMHHKVFHLYGHSHDNLEKYPHGKSMDCGIVTAHRIKGSYELFEYSEIKKILSNREMVLLDHHSSGR